MEARIVAMFQRVLQRAPNAAEVGDARQLLALAKLPEEDLPTNPTQADWQYGYGRVDSQTHTVDFTALPFFSGSAWQGSTSYPDGRLGWVQLSAAGGHPGDDLEHTAIRRWTAPHTGLYRINSRLNHEPSVGDGIHSAIVHSTSGLLAGGDLHHASQELALYDVQLDAGQTLDFVVDIAGELNSDQFLWHIEIASLSPVAGSDQPTQWNSLTDFPRSTTDKLDAWEQLAQVLLCSNEFLFVD